MANGMRGKKHKVDSDGITPLKWRSRKSAEKPFPDGGNIKVKFPEGPNGGTWDKSTMVCRSYWQGRSVGVFPSWIAAVSRIVEVSRVHVDVQDVPVDLGMHGQSTEGVIAELERRAKVLLDAADVLRGKSNR